MRRGAEGTVVGMPATGPSSVRWRSRGTQVAGEEKIRREREPCGLCGCEERTFLQVQEAPLQGSEQGCDLMLFVF